MPVAVYRQPAREIDDLTLARAQRGEEGACRALVGHYQQAVFSLLGRMLFRRGGEALVEDLAQETFLRVFRFLADFTPGGPARLSTWILTIATRLAIDELRKRGPETALDVEAAPAPSTNPEGAADRRLLKAAIAAALARLSPDHRAVVILREVHELEYQEIARALGVDVGTVKSRLSRARGILRAALGEVR